VQGDKNKKGKIKEINKERIGTIKFGEWRRRGGVLDN
jgi:hypothetical protein